MQCHTKREGEERRRGSSSCSTRVPLFALSSRKRIVASAKAAAPLFRSRVDLTSSSSCDAMDHHSSERQTDARGCFVALYLLCWTRSSVPLREKECG